ncbi:MAG: CoA-binding protein [Burkholderiales bacterium]
MSAIGNFLRPSSIAVVGAGEQPTSSGGAVLRNLQAAGFRGRIVPVNPRGGEMFGLRVATSLEAMEAPVDLVAILVKPESVEAVVLQAARTGHRHLMILPGGFAEAGAAGQARNARLQQLAQEHGITIGGPNCAGNINLLDANNPFAATFFRAMPRGGSVAMISQSGALIEEAIDASHADHIPLGAVVSVGNSLHLGIVEYLEELGRDPLCKAILLYVESLGDAARFAQVARGITRRKPVVALIGGRTEAGRAAAFRHTGSRAVDDAVIEEFCRQSGIVRVKSLRRLLLAGKAFGKFPQGIGRRILLLSNSGGPGVLAADQAVEEGLTLPALPSDMATELVKGLPPEASVANPMDLLADAREDRFALALSAALRHAPSAFDAILMIHIVPFMVDADRVVDRLAKECAGTKVPILHSMMGTLEERAKWFAGLERAGVPVFRDPEEMCVAAGALMRYRQLSVDG